MSEYNRTHNAIFVKTTGNLFVISKPITVTSTATHCFGLGEKLHHGSSTTGCSVSSDKQEFYFQFVWVEGSEKSLSAQRRPFCRGHTHVSFQPLFARTIFMVNTSVIRYDRRIGREIAFKLYFREREYSKFPLLLTTILA